MCLRTLLPAAFVLAAALAPAPAGAASAAADATVFVRSVMQTASIRGTLADRATGQIIAGALVVLVDAREVRRGAALTDAQGGFTLAVGTPGRYTLRAERIGYATVISEPLDVAAGERVSYRMTARVQGISLEGITVSGRARCQTRPGGGTDTQRLWEEAQKALHATAWAEETRRFIFSARRFERTLDSESGRIVREDARTVPVVGTPFHSVPAAELQRHGYVQRDGEERVFYAPDAQVLLSDAFLDGHCFRVVAGDDSRAGWVGLGFEPVRTRSLPDVRGTLWLDRVTSELREMEYRYTGLDPEANRMGAGGRMEFRHLPGGAWIVQTWSIRMPVLERAKFRVRGAQREVLRMASVREEGGEVLEIRTGGDRRVLHAAARSALTGTVYDSVTAAPLAAAEVFLSGTAHRTTTDAEGRFRLEGLAPGSYALSFSHPRLDSLGYRPEPRTTSVSAEREERVALAIPTRSTVRAASCGGQRSGGVLFGTVVNPSNGVPVAGAQVRVTWGSPRDQRVATADAGGDYVVCGLPTGVRLTVAGAFLQHRSPAASITLAPGAPREHAIEVRAFVVAARTADGTVFGASGQPVRVTLRLVDPSGAVLEGAGLRLVPHGSARDPRARVMQGVTNSDGRAIYASVAPGVYRAELSHPGFTMLPQPVAVGGGGDVEVQLLARADGAGSPEQPTSRVVVHVRDAASGQALPRVKVRFPGKGLEGTTAATGIATFAAVDTGTHVLQLEHPQRGTYTRQVRVGPQREMGLELRIPLQYALEGLVVTARTPRELERRARATRRDVIEREDIEEVLGSKRHVGELLQGRMPGVRVFEGTFPEAGQGPSRRVCIEITRRQQQVSKRRQCSMIAVYVDGTRISDPGSYLLGLPLSALESVEVLGPMTAATRYGTNAGFGVLEIYTRGNGPNVSR